MKISNETKIGALAAVSITLLVLGFNFLKGKTIFSDDDTLYAKYTNVQGLLPSNPVFINGMQVGQVYNITSDKEMKAILVNITLTKDVKIPVNSVAIIKSSPLATTSVEIKLGDARAFLAKNDTIATEANAGVFNETIKKLDPVLFQVTNAVRSLDSVLMAVNNVLDPNSKNNIRNTLENLNRTTANLIQSSASLGILLNTQTGALAKTLNNVSAFSGNLAANNEKISQVMTNLDKTTGNLAKMDFEKTLNTLNATVAELKTGVSKLNSNTGTAGLLLNDTKLYNNLNATSYKINLLLDDIKTNPKRYISFSVFGKKDKGSAVTAPLPIDTLNAPYIR